MARPRAIDVASQRPQPQSCLPVSVEISGATGKRNLIVVSSLIPVAALFVLLGWAVARSDSEAGGFGLNSKPGEISINQGIAPDFLKQGLYGETVTLSGLRGKVVMVDFWSSWCLPCRQEAAGLAQVYREYDGKNVEFIGVAIWDNLRDAARYVQEFDLQYPNVLDQEGEITIDYGVVGIPEKFFIDPQGNLVRKFAGPMDPEALKAVLEGLLVP